MKQQLLLPSAHMAVLVTGEESFLDKLKEKAKIPLLVLGVLVIVMGGFDLLRHLPSEPSNSDALHTAFAPAATLVK